MNILFLQDLYINNFYPYEILVYIINIIKYFKDLDNHNLKVLQHIVNIY